MKISASIYSDTHRDLKETIEDLVAHQVDMLHVDCNDNPKVFEDIRAIRNWCSLPIDLHIISETPERYFDLLREVPVEFVTFQYEELPEGFNLPMDIPGQKGLAIVTPTAVSVFERFSNFDFLLLMATVPGQSGGKFDAVNFSKIRQFKKRFPDKLVHVDGGVNGEVSFILRNMGVHASVSGSFLFKAASVGQALMDLTKREIDSQFRIKDFMIPREECPIVELQNLSLESALRNIETGSLGFVVVENQRQFLGIVSNADVRRTLLRNINDLNSISPTELINQKPLTIAENKTVNEMLDLVRASSFPVMYLPVLDDSGVLSGSVVFFHLIRGEA
jgi:ribulose-phosphate 3-epimerase